MDHLYNILREVPLFSHCTSDELRYLLGKGRFTLIRQGQSYDLKRGNTLNVVVNGFFEIEALGRSDLVYLSPGSFFGKLAFSENRHQGRVKALVDSSLIAFDESEIYRFFLVHFKALRGYIRTLNKLGFTLSEPGKGVTRAKTRVIAVDSASKGGGSSFFSSILSLDLADRGPVIICDCSGEGRSVFDYLQQKITPPLAQKRIEDESFELKLRERIVSVNDKLDLLNISHDIRVQPDPSILSPVFFLLAGRYSTIIIDLGGAPQDFKNHAYRLADRICLLLKKPGERKTLYPEFDRHLRDGQRVFYILNMHYSQNNKSLPEGSMAMEALDSYDPDNSFDSLRECAASDSIRVIGEVIHRKSRAFVFESRLLNAVFFAGFLQALRSSSVERSLFYSSAYSFIPIALFLCNNDPDKFASSVEGFFSESRIKDLHDVTFPDTHIFRNATIVKRAIEYVGNARCEFFDPLPVTLLAADDTDHRLYSTGYLKDMIAASCLIDPMYQRIKVNDKECSSGYPFFTAKAQHLFRSDVDELVQISVINRQKFSARDTSMLPFFSRIMDVYPTLTPSGSINDLADHNILLDFSESELDPSKCIDMAEKASENLVKGLRPFLG